MNSSVIRVKHYVKTSRVMYPVRWLWILIRLPRYINRLQQQLPPPAPPSALPQPSAPPYSYIRQPDPLLDRAEKRHGFPVSSLSPAEKKKSFYSYFSEIGDENYESCLRKQYMAYLPFIPIDHHNPFLDIGCGAGEFVKFLGEYGVRAMGIDQEASEVERAKARGLNVSQAEAMQYLKSTDQKFSGISLIEVIEHVPFEQVGDLIECAVSKLIDHGVLIIETINMRHPLSVDGFYTDPTHQRPVPEDYITFLMQWHGLKNLKVVYTNPVKLPGVDWGDVRRTYCTYASIGYRMAKSW